MSYAAHTKADRRHVAQGSSLAHTLHDAIKFVAKTGEDVEVVDLHALSVVYDVEADTKADESAPFFPVIVHDRTAD